MVDCGSEREAKRPTRIDSAGGNFYQAAAATWFTLGEVEKEVSLK